MIYVGASNDASVIQRPNKKSCTFKVLRVRHDDPAFKLQALSFNPRRLSKELRQLRHGIIYHIERIKLKDFLFGPKGNKTMINAITVWDLLDT